MMPRILTIGLGWLSAFGGLAIGLCAEHGAPAEPPTRPNIVLILADDMGFSDLGCYGSEIATPNIDRLAAEGVRFTQFYNTGRCCPTRAALLTGLYSHQAGVGLMIEDRGWPAYRGEINDHCVTLAEALGAAGYRTNMVGKWHLVHMRITGKPQINHRNQDPFWLDKRNWPRQRGFDSFYGTIIGVDDYFDPFTLDREQRSGRDRPARVLLHRRDRRPCSPADRRRCQSGQAVLSVRGLHRAALAAARAAGRYCEIRERLRDRLGRTPRAPPSAGDQAGDRRSPLAAFAAQPRGAPLGRYAEQSLGRASHGRLRRPDRSPRPGRRDDSRSAR